jgi:hypothetical protein
VPEPGGLEHGEETAAVGENHLARVVELEAAGEGAAEDGDGEQSVEVDVEGRARVQVEGEEEALDCEREYAGDEVEATWQVGAVVKENLDDGAENKCLIIKKIF